MIRGERVRRIPPSAVRCKCGQGIPVAALVSIAWVESVPVRIEPLEPRSYDLGRGLECEVHVQGIAVSRQHASLEWIGRSFRLRDLGSANGTFVNDEPVPPAQPRLLASGDIIRIGESSLRYVDIRVGEDIPYNALLTLIRKMSSLDTTAVVSYGLDLLRLVASVDRACLVGAGVDPRLERLLTSLDDPSLEVSRTYIELALREGSKQSSVFPAPGDAMDDGTRSESALRLNLRRLWVRPVMDVNGRPIAAVYLDSKESGELFSDDVEAMMDAVVEQIQLALQNALLHAELVGLNLDLERKVDERTKALEESRAQLIGQDRLATLGRLVAAIAHELNNPVGAIVSLSESVRSLQDSVLTLQEQVATICQEPEDETTARALLNASLRSAEQVAPDTRSRRRLKGKLATWLGEQEVPLAGVLARRFSRMNLQAEQLEPSLALLSREGELLSSLAERAYTFARSLKTIDDCARSVARIVAGLKTYAHLDNAEFEEADIHRSLEAALAVIGARIPPGITVESEFDPIPPFEHRVGALAQVWTNLIDNAVRAMGETGVLTITTHDEGERARVSVRDTGGGIPDSVKDRIFELDVTTRGPGAGLGLGLPICKTIVEKNHGGTISFETGGGCTTFTIVLPKKPVVTSDDPVP